MHELRKDPLLGKWVAVLKDSKEPEHYLQYPLGRRDAAEESTGCMFCSGREPETPPEIFALRQPGSPPDSSGWHTRVVPKSNPLFQIEGDLGRKGIGMYDKMNSIGANEIIIESPQHNVPVELMGPAQMKLVLATYRHRIAELEKDPRFRYLLIFKDHGKSAGEVYHHPHAQVVATPVIPKGIKEELDGAKDYFFYKERCIFCDMIDEELQNGRRIIMETGHFVAFTPFASITPFEFWIMPKKHNCAFQDSDDEEMEDLSFVLTTALKKMNWILKDPPYHYVLHTAPNRVPRKDHWHTLGEDFHWHIEIMPELLSRSGFELSSEMFVLTTSPEDAADYLRGASPLS
jgi:UDPglucose--hexose-1-phosphate uridylyltransferase